MTDILRVIARLRIQIEKVKSYEHILQNLVLNALMHDHPQMSAAIVFLKTPARHRCFTHLNLL